MTRLALAALLLTLSACRAVERITESRRALYESKCHPGLYLISPPPEPTTPACEWHVEIHQGGR